MEEHGKENVKKKLFYGLKYTTFGILVVLFLLYFIYLIYRIITDIPIKSTGYDILKELKVPDMEICSNSNGNLRILRCDFKSKDNTTKHNNCSEYIISEKINLGPHQNFCKTFKGNKNYTEDGLNQIGFYFNIPNISAEEANNTGIASLSIQLTSPDFNPLLNNSQVISDMDKAINSSLFLQWDFIAGMVNYSAVVKFTTTAYKTILPGDVGAIIGFTPNYHTTYFIESNTHYFPFNSNPAGIPNGTDGYFSIAATTEQRSYTVFNALASVGGISGILLGVYAFLFGQSINPYGHVHHLCKMVPGIHSEKVIDEKNEHEIFEKCLNEIENLLKIKKEPNTVYNNIMKRVKNDKNLVY
ncbi:12685_t:CDS:2, partial [Gigaspora margarita]